MEGKWWEEVEKILRLDRILSGDHYHIKCGYVGSLMSKMNYLGDLRNDVLNILGVGETWLVESDHPSFVSLKVSVLLDRM